MTEKLTFRGAVLGVVIILLVGLFLLVRQPQHENHVTAHFSRAVSVYKGTDVRVLGVNVGRVTAVIPEGNSVRVEMEYDSDVKLPADAKAVIITPTLVADRFVQLTPVYTKGAVMKNDADIPLDETGTPVELDRIYAALQDLTTALGPNGVNKNGTLNHLLESGAHALDGQGARGNEMLRKLSQAVQTFGRGSGPLFDTVDQLAQFTNTLATNDSTVRTFVTQLAGVSSQLTGERVQIQRTVAAVARTVGTVRNFVHDNRSALVDDVQRLTRTVQSINSERTSLDTALAVAPVAINNLTLAYNTQSGTIGSEIGIQGNEWDADGFLCAIVQQSSMLPVQKDLACQIFKELLQPIEDNIPAQPASGQKSATGAGGSTAPQQRQKRSATSAGSSDSSGSSGSSLAPTPRELQMRYVDNQDATLTGLLGGGTP